MKKEPNGELLSEEQLENVQGGLQYYEEKVWAKCKEHGCNWKWEGQRYRRSKAEAKHTADYGHDRFYEDDGELS